MLRIVYCDDEVEYRSTFQQNHADPDTEITTTNDVDRLPAFLGAMKRPPDLLVLDLYHTACPPGSDEARRVNAEVERHLRAVGAAHEALKKVVDDGKRPAALEALATIRGNPRLEHLPVLLYTRQGLSLLEDDQLNRAMELHAEWMLKGRGAGFERARMLSFVTARRAQRYRRQREIAMVFLGAVAAFLLERGYDLGARLLGR